MGGGFELVLLFAPDDPGAFLPAQLFTKQPPAKAGGFA